MMTDYDEAPWGWQTIVDNLEAQLRYIDPFYRVVQVKEKFGTLRYYYDSDMPYGEAAREIMENCVTVAEILSGRTCEACGENRTAKKVGDEYIRTDIETKATQYWVKTLCAECRVKDAEKYSITEATAWPN